ncbi:MAG: hypothetical protein L3J69_02210 [Desulfobacula sp.]|nr:hypothetical protein [Desulfobacula sp.]
MKFIKVVTTFKAKKIALAEELICNIFFSHNLKGVICDVPLQGTGRRFWNQYACCTHKPFYKMKLPLSHAGLKLLKKHLPTNGWL